MVVVCDLEQLKEVGLSPTEFCYIMCVHRRKDIPYVLSENQLERLEENLWIKIIPGGFVPRQKFYNFVQEKEETDAVDSWIEEWRDIWPKGVKTAGRPVIGDKQDCTRKMKWFLKEYPEITKDKIFEATKMYVFDKQRENYHAMTCADYFICKEVKRGDKISLLSILLEDLEGKDTLLKQMEEGGGSFHKEV